MTGIHNFIIELKEPLSDTFTTESGVELYANKDFSVDRLSNRVAKVVSTPLLHDSVIKKGYEVMFEPTILYKQIYQGKTQHYTALMDRDKMLFKLMPNMIILYRENEECEWKGHLNNLMVEQIVEEEPVISTFLILPETSTPKYKKGFAKVLYPNQWLKDKGVKKGDEILIDPLGGVNFWIKGKHYWWIRSIDVLGKVPHKEAKAKDLVLFEEVI